MTAATLTVTFALWLAAARNLKRLLPAGDLYLYGVEDDFENCQSREVFHRVNRRQILADLTERRFRAENLEALSTADSFARVSEIYCDTMDCDSFQARELLTAAERDRRAKERERRRLERLAGEIARRHNCSVDSVEFIRACKSELRGFREYREGLREDGLCIGFGVSPDQWFEEFNASQGDSATVSEVLAWLAAECPLLWARAQEAEAAGESEDEG